MAIATQTHNTKAKNATANAVVSLGWFVSVFVEIRMSSITLGFVAGSVLWLTLWQLIVVVRRRGMKIGFGHADDKGLRNRIRVHANALENLLPFCLLLILLDWQIDIGPWTVACCAAMALGRLAHPFGMLNARRYHIMRVVGMGLSFTATLLLAGRTIVLLYG